MRSRGAEGEHQGGSLRAALGTIVYEVSGFVALRCQRIWGPKRATNHHPTDQRGSSLPSPGIVLCPVLGGPWSLAAPDPGFVLLHDQSHLLLNPSTPLSCVLFSVGLTGPQGPQGESLGVSHLQTAPAKPPIPAFQPSANTSPPVTLEFLLLLPSLSQQKWVQVLLL